MNACIRPFRFIVEDDAIAELHERIARTRWPDEVNDEQWNYGIGLEYVRELVTYWRERFDWRAAEARINALPNFRWCAWVAEKFHEWSDCERDGQRDLRNAVSWDTLLANVALYWFTGTIASSLRLYREQTRADGHGIPPRNRLSVPVGVANYPMEIFRCPKAWAERTFDLVHWYEAPRGGHFAALEQPQLFAQDLWAFKRRLAER